MQPMKFFLDTHDQRTKTFPAGISREQFAEFYPKYEKACREEGVVNLRIHVGFEDGRAFCLNMAPSADHRAIWSERTRQRFNPEERHCMSAAAVADAYLAVIEQDRSAWTSELDLRPPR